MIPPAAIGPERPTLFCLHFLGGSQREWQPLGERLADRVRVVAIDLPGFGDAAQIPGYTVAEMADHVIGVVRRDGAGRWMLAGHSMGAKVAMAVARRAEDGAEGLAGLNGLVLLAGSPPCPEPMDEEQRRELLHWFEGSADESRTQADSFIQQNIGMSIAGEALAPALREQAVQDVLRCNRSAWVAWFDSGSREDWRERIGVLATPALVVAGTEDADLGPAAQQCLMAPHLRHARLVALPGAGHLLPLERPREIARLVEEAFATPRMGLPGTAQFNSGPPGRAQDTSSMPGYGALIASSRVSAATRTALLDRGRPDPRHAPRALEPASFAVLQALVERILPQQGPDRIDLARRIDDMLAEGGGDGWRFAALPPDAEAYRLGLHSLEALSRARLGAGFAYLDDAARDALLQQVAGGKVAGPAAGPGSGLDAAGLALWFQDVCADATRLYASHPSTLARLGYSGIAYGGDQPRLPGYTEIGIGRREAWEPVAVADAAVPETGP